MKFVAYGFVALAFVTLLGCTRDSSTADDGIDGNVATTPSLSIGDVSIPSLRGLVVEKVSYVEETKYFAVILRSTQHGEDAALKILDGLKRDLPEFKFRKSQSHYFDHVVSGTKGPFQFIYFVVLGQENSKDTYQDVDHATGPDGVPYVVVHVRTL